jgi:hypothetical protein
MRRFLMGLVAVGMVAAGLGTVSASAGAATQSHAAVAAPASSENGCISNPSNANCNGVWISEAGPCWATSSIVAPNNGGKVFWGTNGYSFETDLRYSTACKSNFSITILLGTGIGTYSYSGKVRRLAGPDGGYLMEHGGWITYPIGSGDVLSPLVYAPDNKAQACGSNNDSDQVACTGAF